MNHYQNHYLSLRNNQKKNVPIPGSKLVGKKGDLDILVSKNRI